MATDWTSGGVVYGVDEADAVGSWGAAFGECVRFRYSDRDGNAVLPKLRDGSAEVCLTVMEGELLVLRGMDCFGPYLDVV